MIWFLWRNSPGPGPPHYQGFTTTLRPYSVGILWTSDQPDAGTSTKQQETFIRERYPWPQRDSNPQSQQTSGRTPTPHTARPLRSAQICLLTQKFSW